MSRLVQPVSDIDHRRGDRNATVTLVEYGDYECPYCGQAYYEVEEVLDKMGDLLFVFRQFPLIDRHPHALAAARAAEAAGLQGMFWEMHSQLFENQWALEREDILGYAREIGLDDDVFLLDADSDAVLAKVQWDYIGGMRSGVAGTPTFFINDQPYNGPYQADVLLEVLSGAVAAATRS